MPISARTLAKLVRAGVGGKALIELVRSIDRDMAAMNMRDVVDEQAERRRASDRQRARARRLSSAGSADGSADSPQTNPSPRAKAPGTPKNLPPTSPPSPPKGGSSPAPRAELEIVLDPEHAQAVVDHRQRIRRPLTGRAARLLAGKLARTRDPNAAADEMIANGWQGFEPEWLENRNGARPNGSDAPKKKSRATRAVERRGLKQDEGTNENSLDLEATRTA